VRILLRTTLSGVRQSAQGDRRVGTMAAKRTVVCGTILLVSALGYLLLVPPKAASRLSMNAADSSNLSPAEDQEPIPAFHSEVPKGPLPATLDPSQFNEVLVQNAYTLASRVKRVLYQQPCYCHCDRSQGHGSLLDCFAGKHAAECGVCIREALYSYEQSRKGKTAAQIRDGIEQGEWHQVDVSKYSQAPVPAAAK
jgi:hypothetical protein